MKVRNALNAVHALLPAQPATVSYSLQVEEIILANTGIGIHASIMDLLELLEGLIQEVNCGIDLEIDL